MMFPLKVSRRLVSGVAIALSLTLLAAPMLQPEVAVARSFSSFWESVKRVFAPRPPVRYRGGGRGPEAIISPGLWVDRSAQQKIPLVWHQRPVILYQAPINRQETPTEIKLIDAASNEIIQEFKVCGDDHARLLVDRDLEPGKTYRIEQFRKDKSTAVIKFQVMAGAMRNKFNRQLKELEEQNRTTPEQLSDSKVELFVNNQLWSDALQEMSRTLETDQDWQDLQALTDEWRKNESIALSP